MKFFYIIIFSLYFSNGIVHSMNHDAKEQFCKSLTQKADNDEVEYKKNAALIQTQGKRHRGFLIGCFGFLASLRIPALFDKDFDAKYPTLVRSLYILATAGALGYGLDSIFCKAYEDNAKSTFEVHGLFKRIKNKLINFSI
jgi:hypothetical protein